MSTVTTVLGEIPPEQLGFCQSHEHLYIADGYPARISPDQRIDDSEKSLRELELYRQAGGGAIVDAQPVGCGRDIAMLEKISRGSGVHVIASTGFHKMLFYPEGHWVYSFGEDRLTRLYISELTEGAYVGCDSSEPEVRAVSRAGQIKSALDAGEFSAQYQKLFHAASEAAKEVGCALMVHIEKGSDPIALADFLYRRGVPLNRVIFCHMDRAVANLDVHREICGMGITLEYDTIARPKYHDDIREAEIIRHMLDAGFEDLLLASLDVTRARLFSYGSEIGIGYILNSFIPLLRGFDVSDEQLRKIFTGNPARAFSF